MVTVDSVLKEFNTCRQPKQDYKEGCFFDFDIHFTVHFNTNRKCWVLTKISNPLYNSNLKFGVDRCHFLSYISYKRHQISLNSAKDYNVFSVAAPQLGVIRNGEIILVQSGHGSFFDVDSRPAIQLQRGTLTDVALNDIKDLCLFTQGYDTSSANFGVYLYPKDNKWSVLDLFLELQRKIKNVSDLYADLSVRALDGASNYELGLMLNAFIVNKEPLLEPNIGFSRDLLFVPSSAVVCLPDKYSYCYRRILEGYNEVFRPSYYEECPKFSVGGAGGVPPCYEYMCLPINGVDKNKIYIKDNILASIEYPLAIIVDSEECPSFIMQTTNKDADSINYTKCVNTQLFVRLLNNKGTNPDILVKDYENPDNDNLGLAGSLLDEHADDLIFTIKSRVAVNNEQKEKQLETKIIQLDKGTGRYLLCPRKN